MHYNRHSVTASRHQWLRDYAHVRVNQWQMGFPCSLIGQFVKN